MKRTRRGASALVVGACLSLAALVGVGPANAANFYNPPAKLPQGDGVVVKTQPMSLITSVPLVNGPWPGKAKRVMYTSQLQDGTPTAVTGTYIEPTTAWTGKGERPTIVIAPGTIGQGDQCAPSKNFPAAFTINGKRALNLPVSIGLNYEILAADAWNAVGARVFMTDYIGLGTPGIHTYVNRVEEAHAVLDGARAANELSGTGKNTPIAFWGYSQGGGATAAATELKSEYAPELNLKGTFAGAPPADLTKVLSGIDGNLIGGAIGYALNGFIARDPALKPEIDKRLTAAGRKTLAQLSQGCIADMILQDPLLKTSTLTKDGRPLAAHLAEIPEAQKIIAAQKIGNLKPAAPTLILSAINDDVIPHGQARQLAVDWCRKGGTVKFETAPLPSILPGLVINHALPLLTSYLPGSAFQYVLDRLNGVPEKGCSIH